MKEKYEGLISNETVLAAYTVTLIFGFGFSLAVGYFFGVIQMIVISKELDNQPVFYYAPWDCTVVCVEGPDFFGDKDYIKVNEYLKRRKEYLKFLG